MLKLNYKLIIMKKISILVLLFASLFSLKSFAQDVHLSQFVNTPLLQNPSFAGKSGGDIRAIANYRSQWGSITTNPFQVLGASFDMIFNNRLRDNFLAGGISVYSDLAGASKMRTTLVSISAAYHIKINNYSYFSGGIQGGFNQKSIDRSDLRWDSQFEGTGHNPLLSSNENLSHLSQMKPTVSAGVSYLWSNTYRQTFNTINRGVKKINIGIAVHHFNSPNFNFAKQEKLGLKYIASIKGSFGASSSPLVIEPAAYVAIQKKATDIILGAIIKYVLIEGSHMTSLIRSASIGFGGYYRVGDAIIPTVQVEWAGFGLGLSYDANLSQLTDVSKGRGGFEISLKYISLKSTYDRRPGARYL